MLCRKRKNIDTLEFNIIIKKFKRFNEIKRKIASNNLKDNKKQKCYTCILHEEKYICDIYECNGKINRDKFLIN